MTPSAEHDEALRQWGAAHHFVKQIWVFAPPGTSAEEVHVALEVDRSAFSDSGPIGNWSSEADNVRASIILHLGVEDLRVHNYDPQDAATTIELEAHGRLVFEAGK